MSVFKNYTKAQLDEIARVQLENLQIMNSLLRLRKEQNEMISNAGRKMKAEKTAFKKKTIQGEETEKAS